MLVGRRVWAWVVAVTLIASGWGGTLGEARAGEIGTIDPAKKITTDDLMDTTKHPVSVTMAMQADSFFGFNPSIYGTYGLSGPKARLYPNRTHSTLTTLKIMTLCMIVARTFLVRTSPP